MSVIGTITRGIKRGLFAPLGGSAPFAGWPMIMQT